MNSRTFGVEIEFNSAGLGQIGVRSFVRSLGLSHWVSDTYAVGHDGSEIELRSPILQGYRGLKELKTVMNALTEHGCYTTDADGLHIHHGASEFVGNYKAIHRLVISWMNNQNVIDGFVKQYRRNDYGACGYWNEHHLRALEEHMNMSNGYYLGPRGALNIGALAEHETIELRQHEGTLNFEQAEAWINFGQRFITNVLARKRPLGKTESPAVLMNRIRVPKKARSVLVTKTLTAA